jgi:2-keto-3-deoxy-6-phosphogluconate aldolase
MAKNAGASFISTKITSEEIISSAKSHNLPILSGVLTENDCRNALHYKADALKFYPSSKISPSEFGKLVSSLNIDRSITPLFMSGSVEIIDLENYLKFGGGVTNFAIGFDLSVMDFDTVERRLNAYDEGFIEAKKKLRLNK